MKNVTKVWKMWVRYQDTEKKNDLGINNLIKL